MDKVIINSSTLTSIADAIRSATGKSDIMYPSEMAERIGEILPEKVEFGSVTPEEDVNSLRVEHRLGEIPCITFVWKESGELKASSARAVLFVNGGVEYSEDAGRDVSTFTAIRCVKDQENSYSTYLAARNAGDDGYGDSATHFFTPVNTSVYFYGGETYKWMAVGF